MPSLVGAKFANLCGGIAPAAPGLISAYSTSSADNGALKLAYKHGSAWVTSYESLTLAGLTPVPNLATVAADSDWIAIYNNGVAPTGDIYLTINSVIVGVIYGTQGCWCASTLYDLALATAQNAAISCSNRLTNPASGIGSFAAATWWPGADNGLAVPGDDVDAGDFIGYCLRLRWPGGAPATPINLLQASIALIGDPDATDDADLKYYPGEDGNPNDDTSPVGGDIDTAAEIDQDASGSLIYNIKVLSTDATYRGVAYRKNEAA